MNRRSVLKLLGVGGTLGVGGCLRSSSEPSGTEPLTDTFPDSDPEYWDHSLAGASSISTAESLFVLSANSGDDTSQMQSRATLTRIARDGSNVWSQAIDATTGNLRATGDTVYLLFNGRHSFGGDAVLEAREPTSGDQRWDQTVSPYPRFVGAASAAVFVGGTNDDPTRLPVQAFEEGSGQSRWRKVTAMPMGGLVSHRLCLVHGYPDKVIALAAQTGEIQWQKSPGEVDHLMVIDDTLVVVTRSDVVAFSLPDGSQQWRFDSRIRSLAGGSQRWHWGGRIQSLASEVTQSGSETTLYLGEEDGTVSAIDLVSGKERWSITPSVTGESEWVRAIAPVGDSVVVRKWGTLYGLDAADGTERWRQVLTPFERLAGPVTINRTAFVIHASTRDEFAVKTFEVGSGRKQWRFTHPWSDNLLPNATVFAEQFVVAPAGGLYGFTP